MMEGRHTVTGNHTLKQVAALVLVGYDPGKKCLASSFFPTVDYLALERKMPICGGNPGVAAWYQLMLLHCIVQANIQMYIK